MTLAAPGRRWTGPAPLPSWADHTARWAWAFIAVAVASAIVLVSLTTLRELVVPLVVAALLAVVFAPVVDRLEALRVPRGIAALTCTLLIVVATVLVVGIVVVGVVDRSDELSQQLDHAWAELGELTSSPAISEFLSELDVQLDATNEFVLEGTGARITPLINSAVGLVSGLVLALALLYYLLKDGTSMVRASVARRTPSAAAQTERILANAARTIRANSRGRTLLAAIQGVFITVVLAVLGVPLPVSIGLVNFVAAFVPFIGVFIGGAFAVLMAFSEGGVAFAAWALLAVTLMNTVLVSVLEPRLMGSRMRMRPLTVLVATVTGGIVAGLLGLILAAPLVAIGSDLNRELRATGYFDPPIDPGVVDP